MSLMKHMNRTGESTELCGSPSVKRTYLLFTSTPYDTRAYQSRRNWWIIQNAQTQLHPDPDKIHRPRISLNPNPCWIIKCKIRPNLDASWIRNNHWISGRIYICCIPTKDNRNDKVPVLDDDCGDYDDHLNTDYAQRQASQHQHNTKLHVSYKTDKKPLTKVGIMPILYSVIGICQKTSEIWNISLLLIIVNEVFVWSQIH